MSFPTGN